MPTKDRRIQIRFPAPLAAKVDELAASWSRTHEPLTPSEVVRECVERIHAAEAKARKRKVAAAE